ncbi:alpha/beta fold hydrolase, partial [Staphylococcus aureus]
LMIRRPSFLMIRRPPRSTQGVSSAASDVYKRQVPTLLINGEHDPLIKDKNHFKLEAHFLNVTKKIFEHSG